MLDYKQKGKIKNDKIMRWRTELSCYRFDIVYRPGVDNIPPDVLSRDFSAAIPSVESLSGLHNSLCHPGVTRMYHFVRTRNLPYSMEDVKQMTKACRVCAECKPQFHTPAKSHLVKATQPFERLMSISKAHSSQTIKIFTSSTLLMSTVDFLLFSLARMSAGLVLYSAYVRFFRSLECLHITALTGEPLL